MDIFKSLLRPFPSKNSYRAASLNDDGVDLPLVGSGGRDPSPLSTSPTPRHRRSSSFLGSSTYFVILHVLLLVTIASLLFSPTSNQTISAPPALDNQDDFPSTTPDISEDEIIPPPYTPPPPAATPASTPAAGESLYDLSPEGLAKFGVDAMYERQSTTLRQARARYELKTGRKTPKGYDKWYHWVKERGLLVDDYDQIYKDFAPFYELKSPHHIKKTIDQDFKNAVDNGRRLFAYHSKSNGEVERPGQGGPFDGDWEGILKQFAKDIPDYDVIFNYQDEPRVVFNVRDPEMVSKAYDLDDKEAYRRGPHPTSEYYLENGKCRFPNSGVGLANLVNPNNAFLLSSPSTGFTENLRPILSQTKIEPCFADILVPSIYYYQRASWGPREAINNPDTIPWEEKIPKLWWRGQTSGGNMEGKNFRHFQRFRFITLANEREDIINAKFTNLDYCLEICEEVEKEFPLSEKKGWTDAYPYKYVFDIDGNTFSGRFMGLLHGKALVFKSTIWTEFWSSWLLPYVHYIPVLPDLSDLYEKVDWAVTHDLEARRIQAAGAELVRRVITEDQMDAYYYAVLLDSETEAEGS
ncbi:glycosyl transferase family 90-domain-containing protein [Mrakia frigida]|uniref:glycosyl transferase family 90-domain-containing protein n=1 Tax=Mrakia frigida TaxID=29902 RepID=UPI003FCC006F